MLNTIKLNFFYNILINGVTVGKSSNHAIVMATLFIGGENHGMQAFIVPIRRMDNHLPLPGFKLT